MSVRRFILDRFDQLRRRGQRTDLDSEAIALPDDADLADMVELAQLRRWILDRVADLEAERVDPRVRIPIARPREVGAILRLHIDGKTQLALKWLDAYYTQNSKGPELESVLWMRVVLLCKHPVNDECRKAANTYVHKSHFNADRTALANQLINTLD